MERKKITFDSFIRGSIGCVLVVGILMLVGKCAQRSVITFLYSLVDRLRKVYPLVKFFQ